ncbi:protein kinase [Kitasatospora sp. RB6PN24]|uniref:protein kinase domain-containing protein n=1 Tax=Kitasatospora humi TaxID=2893891 RepID=UPI001E3096E2|nr:protein kinase [Kitasatospora humi]MCC9310345.1 protein kinase [Kitasatospora humi]
MRAGPGQTVAGRYQVTDRPADAGPGLDRIAVDGRTGVRVLLEAVELPELLVPELTGSTDFAGSRWLDPAPVLAEVAAVLAAVPDHPRLRQSFDAVAEDGVVWLAVEDPTATRLPELLAAAPLSPHRVAEVAADLVAALGAVHRAGRVHGNVAAEQVLVCEDGAALLGGLAVGAAQEALARELGGGDLRRWGQARAGLVGSRAEHWPPELLVDLAAVSPAADSWALGVLLHRVLTGRGPFDEQSPTALFAAVRSDRRVDSAGCGPLRPLVDRLLAADPRSRPTVDEAREWLAELLADAPEPYRAAPRAEALPVLRPRRLPVRRARRPVAARAAGPAPGAAEHARHARGAGRPSWLLPLLLVGGVLVTMVLALTAVVLFSG